MSEFTIHTTSTAPEASQEALRLLEQNVGFIPNLAATIAGSPVALQAFVAAQSALRGSTLSPVEREVVGITVSYANRSAYSMAAHSAFAIAAGASADALDALRTGSELPNERHQALHAFAAGLLNSGGHADEAELAAFLDAGYTTEQALEVVTQIAYTTLANLVANVAATPVDPQFEPQAWSATAA